MLRFIAPRTRAGAGSVRPDTAADGKPIGRLCVFGAYSDDDLYQRNRVLVEVLSEITETVEIVRRPMGRQQHAFGVNLRVLQRIAGVLSDLRFLWTRRAAVNDCDVVFIPYPAIVALLALRVGRWRSRRNGERKTLIADAFL